MHLNYFFLFIFSVILLSCSEENNDNSVKDDPYKVHALPDNMSRLQQTDLEPILSLLGDAKIIAASEGTHGMIEPFFWRNELIKLLVKKKRISAVALESGLVESKIAYDYVLGKDIDLDSALNNGLLCGFGDLAPNRELLKWLREYNAGQSKEDKVHFYGFDIPGCAPNPVLEYNFSGFNHALKYFVRVNPLLAAEYKKQLDAFKPLLRIKDGQDDTKPHFTDIDSLQWKKLRQIQQNMMTDLKENADAYLTVSSQTDYDWAERAVTGAGQNIDFLYAFYHPEMEYSPRERGLADNAKWISAREKRPILLFAHIAHLAKELHMKDEKMPYPQCGEYLGEELGDDYLVIGNFYSVLDYSKEGKEEVMTGTMEEILQANGPSNYFTKLNKSDTIWSKEWAYAKPSSGGQVYMIPAKSIDIILYNKIQNWILSEK